MKKLDLNAWGVEEMNVNEVMTIGGGTEIGYWLGYYGDEFIKAVIAGTSSEELNLWHAQSIGM